MDIVTIISIAQQLIAAGRATAAELVPIFRKAGLTDEQLNAILDGVIGDAARRQAIAEADAAG